ncbi:MAG: hypothetical protein ACLGIN_11020 [Candidatus Sericytochromatia bacterium]
MGKARIPTDAEIETGRKLGAQLARTEVRAKAVEIDARMRTLTLTMAHQPDAQVVIPLQAITELAAANDEELAAVTLWPSGAVIECEPLDVHLSVEALAFAAIAGPAWLDRVKTIAAGTAGATKTAAKSAASRANGAKGGRPRKNAAIAESARSTERQAAPPQGSK